MSSQIQLSFIELKAIVIRKHIRVHSMGQCVAFLANLALFQGIRFTQHFS